MWARGRSVDAAVAVVVVGLVLVTLPIGTAGAAPGVTQGDVAQAQQEVDRLDTAADAATERYDEGRLQLSEAQQTAAAARHDAAVAAAAVAAGSSATAALVADAYRSSTQSTFVSFVSAGSPQAFLDRAAALEQLATDREASLAVARAARQRSDDAAARAKDAQEAADAVSRQLEQDRNAVETELTAKTTYLHRLSTQLQQQLAAEQAAREAAQRAADARAQEAAALAEQQAQAARVAAAQTSAGQSTATGTAPQIAVPATASGRGGLALQYAESQIGKPYLWAGAGPNAYDCSGLTMWAFAHVGIALPHSAAAQYGFGTHIPISQLEPGDLVFFDDGGYIGHVGIYYGGGEMVDAPHTGATVGIHGLYGGYVGATRL